MLWRGVAFARKHDIRHHMLTMEFTYFLALVVTGLLTFLPGRIMYQVAFGPDGATPQKLMVFGGIVGYWRWSSAAPSWSSAAGS